VCSGVDGSFSYGHGCLVCRGECRGSQLASQRAGQSRTGSSDGSFNRADGGVNCGSQSHGGLGGSRRNCNLGHSQSRREC
jgi:hypothetical protein